MKVLFDPKRKLNIDEINQKARDSRAFVGESERQYEERVRNAAKEVLNSGKINLIKADQALVDSVTERTKGFRQTWLDEAKAKGIDGPAALDHFQAEIKKLDKQ